MTARKRASRADDDGLPDAYPLYDDLIEGASDCAFMLYGDRSQRSIQRIYKAMQRSTMPFFRLNGKVCIRKSKYMQWLDAQELRGRK